MRKIGFLGGSFDPIHFGHIHLGISLQEAHGLDEVLVCPAARSPLKNSIPEEAHHRLEMVKLAVADIPSWKALDWEIQKRPPSFTIDTVRHLLNEIYDKSDVKIFLLMGNDLISELPQWKEVRELFELATPLIGCRIPPAVPQDAALHSKITAGLTTTKILDISATEIRNRIKKRLYCGHLLPAKVLDYIRLHHLY